ncbi:serine/threonine protein kinase, FIKK family [Plasmodium sp. gorilla clade G2]|uniref:serine/threonine protein kinase, FIKK family n=1 Tax=Plasmodium sp. gorilla clade G2 TaxID=880535 RepID=UPI000D213E8A|nr:serine/threonine protein kinase, FIKK family [Plasmodium sp. gorilla clade G2]SOV13904.1 serine/threonine protein kinase, FIKK family [Plasmodium sp. gorilla clade G2]
MEIICCLKYIKNKANKKYIGLFLNLKSFVMYLLFISLYCFFLFLTEIENKCISKGYVSIICQRKLAENNIDNDRSKHSLFSRIFRKKNIKRHKEKIEDEKIDKNETEEEKVKIKKESKGKTKKNSKNKRNQNNLRSEDNNNNIVSRIYDSGINKNELLFPEYNIKNDSYTFMKIIDITPNKNNENLNVNVDDVVPCVSELEKRLNSENKIIYNWELGNKSVNEFLGHAYNFEIYGVNYYDWKLTNIKTVGYDIYRGRGHEMFKAVIPSNGIDMKNDITLFIKKIPINLWMQQYDLMNMLYGEYLMGGENFVMEVMVCAFLTKYYPGISPKLYKVLFAPEDRSMFKNISSSYMCNDINVFNYILNKMLIRDMKGHVVMVSEYYGKDTDKYLRKEGDIYRDISENEKKKIMHEWIKLVSRLHDSGLSHLDISPENTLIGENHNMRLCDFSKSTPLYTYNLRHRKNPNGLCVFQSCCPTVGKPKYEPPECIDLRRKLREMNIYDALIYLRNIEDQEERKKYYFDVECVDKYMLGIMLIWIWDYKYLWNKADSLEDKDFILFKKNNMNLDIFPTTQNWPQELKYIISQLLVLETRKNLQFKDLINHPWFSCNE